MRALVFLFMTALSTSTNADVNCKFMITDPIIDWTGTCENGLASGIGELTYTREGNKVVTFGKFKEGHATGIHLSKHNNIAFIAYWIRSKFNTIGPAYDASRNMTNLPPMKMRWADSNASPVSGIQPDISYEQVISEAKSYVKQKSEPSIDFEIFKAYLEGKVRVTGEDDPPVFGAELKPSGGGKKK